MQALITVEAFRKELRAVPSDMEITFGTSRFLKLPLVFNGIKKFGKNLHIIAVNEVMRDNVQTHEPDHRITAGQLLRQLEYLPDTDNLEFGCDDEANLLQYRTAKKVLNIVLDSDVENREPYRLVD